MMTNYTKWELLRISNKLIKGMPINHYIVKNQLLSTDSQSLFIEETQFLVKCSFKVVNFLFYFLKL